MKTASRRENFYELYERTAAGMNFSATQISWFLLSVFLQTGAVAQSFSNHDSKDDADKLTLDSLWVTELDVSPLATGAQPSTQQTPPKPPVPADKHWVRDLVAQVLERQPELQQADADSLAARARWNETRAAALPQLNISGALGQQEQTLAQGRNNSYKDQRSLQLRLAQPIYDSAVDARTRQNRALYIGSDWQKMSLREQAMAKAVELYAELVRQSRLTELARDNLRLHRQYVAQMKEIARSDVGRASDLPVAQSRVALAESVLTSRLARLESARVQWRALSSLPSPEESAAAPLAEVLRDLPEVELPVTLESAVQESLERSPQLQKALSDVQAAREALQVAQSQNAPKVGLEVRRLYGNNYASIYGEQNEWYAGVNMQWNLAFSDAFARKAASEALQSAQHVVDGHVLRLRSVVETQWFEYQAAHASLNSYRAYTEFAQEVAKSYAEQFRIGRRSLLDVLNAENEMFTARSNALTTQVDLALASWRLLSSRGRLAEELGL